MGFLDEFCEIQDKIKSTQDILRDGYDIAHVDFKNSSLGEISTYLDKQVGELRRIADAAEQRAILAESEAESAKKDARFSKYMSGLALFISAGGLFISVLTYAFK